MTVVARRMALTVALLALAAAAVLVGGSHDRQVDTSAGLTTAADTGSFDPGSIISDDLFFDGAAMSATEVQAFLDVKGAACKTGSDGTPCLKAYSQTTTDRAADAYCAGYTGVANESAATIITRVARSCDISPRVLLVIMQKEQSLVTNTGSSLNATRYQKTMGFACPDTAACDTAYYGFQNQVYAAARQFQRYAAHPTSFGYRAGQTSSVLYNPNRACGSTSVFIRNQATAGLYIYTPYQPNAAALVAGYGSGDACSAYGNRNFWLYFTDWFGSTQSASADASLPLGSFDAVSSSYGKITVSGWAFDPDQPTTALAVHVYVDGVLATGTSASASRPDVAAAHPRAGAYHGYRTSFTAGLGARTVCVYAINVGNGWVNPQLGCRTVDNQDAGAPRGAVDALVGQPGQISVSGWTFDPDSTSARLAVHVYVDGGFAASLTAGRTRTDVANAFGIDAAHGFAGTVAVSAGKHTVCLYAINVGLGSTNTALRCAVVTVANPDAYDPKGSLDRVVATGGTVSLGGWAYDPDVPSGPLTVDVRVDGTSQARVGVTGPRPDVQRALSGAGATTGYTWTGVVAAGRHQVCVYALNVGYGTGDTKLGCRTVTTVGGVAANPVGSLDVATGAVGTLAVRGWSYDVDVPTQPLVVHVYLGGKLVGSSVASASRPDVAAAFPGAGAAHGFSWSGTVASGTHRVCVYAINVGAGSGNPAVGCRTVTVTEPPHAPVGSLDGVAVTGSSVVATGWAFDPDVPMNALTVHVYVDGVARSAVAANGPRSDVGRAHPEAGPMHGFTWSGQLAAGDHTVCVFGINQGAGTLNPSLGCRKVTVR
ncbi:hypothetical protein [uncultured Modestobacter sp.]|uniref:hypothetical protein n=1 Tax=uncultured Modestobacter sp. TaxID=380048 RepID=UPI0026334A3E|nr:hypothetical protein [uncultured Modestobacter sp.]